MSKFKGYELVKLLKAVTATTEPNATVFSYQVEHYNVFGRKTVQYLQCSELQKRFGNLRMNGDRFAIRGGGECRPISEQEFNQRVNEMEQ